MSTPTITITLDEYLLLTIRHNQYAVIDSARATAIRGVPSYETLCHVENSGDALDFYCRPLPILDNNLFRLWYKRDWILNDNKRRETIAHFQKLDDARQVRIDKVVGYFVKTGTSQEIAERTVKSMSPSAFENVLGIIGNIESSK